MLSSHYSPFSSNVDSAPALPLSLLPALSLFLPPSLSPPHLFPHTAGGHSTLSASRRRALSPLSPAAPSSAGRAAPDARSEGAGTTGLTPMHQLYSLRPVIAQMMMDRERRCQMPAGRRHMAALALIQPVWQGSGAAAAASPAGHVCCSAEHDLALGSAPPLRPARPGSGHAVHGSRRQHHRPAPQSCQLIWSWL